ncbi:complement component 1 Q subcomponent-binding protein, mitochondrial [Sporothrix brasiliensis 5110]|uniref:Complement component 1 Q subcomponent-binding protein, mitochondrial n=1 Tax=Sporothrix brasiliensis 5110 TaxID=1398154 RepID=A0A0C2J344_9PEZI|nr:complement component 1 Q subcomponent-binding protein, mitochondrial [Sporothrix brasiliensis 5110]KIH93445.1 complement component 1 Q subcomponent-binding protein, mitochondrial [Sporothrix brasiliensis 5110]
MMSLRMVSRAAPRAAARLSRAPTVSRSSLLTSTAAHPSAFQIANGLRSAALIRTSVSAFSSVAARRAPANNEIDEELSAKLSSEIQFETEIRENEPEATSVKDFLESGLFEIEDVPGREEVVLRRTYNNEKITVTFSVADLANYDPEMYDEDSALADEDIEGGNSARKAEEAGAEDGEDIDTDSASVPCRLAIVVEKPGQGALSVEATAQDGGLVVDNLYYYKDAAHAHEATADAAHSAQRVYPGPAFGSLDEDLQVLLDRYLEERGITQALAVFVPDYLDAKEQREYLGFLNNLKTFVDA